MGEEFINDFINVVVWRMEYVLSIFLAFLVFYLPMKNRKNSPLIVSVGFLLMFVLWATRSLFASNKVLLLFYFAIYIITFLTIYFSLEVTVKQALVLFTCVICLQHFSYKVNYAIIVLIDKELRHTVYYFLSYLIVIALSDLLFYFLFTKKLKNNPIDTQSILTAIITGVSVVTVFFISYFTQNAVIANLDKITVAFLQLYGIVLPIVYVALLFQNMVYIHAKHENEIMEIISAKNRERYVFAKNTIEQMNIKYHDLKHTLTNEEIAAQEKEEIAETITNYSAIVFSGNRILDIVLYEMKLKSENKNVHLISIVDGALLNFMQRNHLYTLFSNLLDNAIEGAEKNEEEERRNIKLSIFKARGSVVITMENYVKGNVEFLDGLPQTTKSDKWRHGFGVKSVRHIVEQYGGILSMWTDENVFHVKIVFPHVEDKRGEAAK